MSLVGIGMLASFAFSRTVPRGRLSWRKGVEAKWALVLDKRAPQEDWAEDVVATRSVSNLLATVSILLVRELEDAESSSEKLVVSSSHQVELAVPEPHFNFISMKRVRGVFPRRIAVFTWAHEKIVRKNYQVDDGLARFGSIGVRNYKLH
jgi:hypothetical protein